jgi:hypothetical protein
MKMNPAVAIENQISELEDHYAQCFLDNALPVDLTAIWQQIQEKRVALKRLHQDNTSKNGSITSNPHTGHT